MAPTKPDKRQYHSGQFIRPKWHLAIFDEERGRLIDFDGNAIKVFPAGDARAWIKSEACPTWKSCRPTTFNVRGQYEVDFIRELMTEPEKRIRQMSLAKRRAIAKYRYLQTFSPGVRPGVLAADPSIAWGVLNCLSRIPESFDIYEHSPAFMVLAYYHWRFRRRKTKCSDFALTRRFLRQPQRRLCQYLGLGDGKSIPRVFRKIPREQISMETVWCTCCAVAARDKLSVELRHLPVLTSDIVHMVADPDVRGLCTRALLHEAAHTPAEHSIYSMLKDVHRMREMLGDESQRSFQTRRACERYHDDLVPKLNKQELGLGPDRPFPPPPIPSTTVETTLGWVHIEYLATSRELCCHGRDQQNCVASLIREVARGALPIYAIRSDFCETHTLSLRRQSDGWRIGELRGPHNAKRDPHIEQAARRWLEPDLSEAAATVAGGVAPGLEDEWLPF